MLRQSLTVFLKSLPMSSNVQNALQKVEKNDLHKRLRNELIMIPIPKAKYFDRKIPRGVSRQDFEEEIIEKQAHVLQSAISRLVKPSAIDPPGILMLNSIREIFDIAGVPLESMKFVDEKFESE